MLAPCNVDCIPMCLLLLLSFCKVVKLIISLFLYHGTQNFIFILFISLSQFLFSCKIFSLSNGSQYFVILYNWKILLLSYYQTKKSKKYRNKMITRSTVYLVTLFNFSSLRGKRYLIIIFIISHIFPGYLLDILIMSY